MSTSSLGLLVDDSKTGTFIEVLLETPWDVQSQEVDFGMSTLLSSALLVSPLCWWRQVGCFLLHVKRVSFFRQSLDMWPLLEHLKHNVFFLTNCNLLSSVSVLNLGHASNWILQLLFQSFLWLFRVLFYLLDRMNSHVTDIFGFGAWSMCFNWCSSYFFHCITRRDRIGCGIHFSIDNGHKGLEIWISLSFYHFSFAFSVLSRDKPVW